MPPVGMPTPPEQQYERAFQTLLTSSNYTSQDEEEKKAQIGDFIYTHISKKVGEDDAGKITGMIVDLDLEEIISSIQRYKDLLVKIEEGKKLLEE